jgi:hypothetical protein
MNIDQIFAYFEANPLVLVLLIAWVLVWKGLALWRAAELKQKGWFVALLVINSLGLLEIIYLATHRH